MELAISPDDQVRLLHIREAANHAVAFARGVTPGDSGSDRMRLRALERCLVLVGDNVAQMSGGLWPSATEPSRRRIIGRRDQLRTAYFEDNASRVLDTVEVDLEPLLAAVDRLLSAEPRADA